MCNKYIRITDPNLDVPGIIGQLTGGNIGAMSVLVQWLEKEGLMAVMALFTSVDMKHLYDEKIWNVFKFCGKDIDRFIYHVQMELPDQITGEIAISGPYAADINREEFFAKRTFGKPGSFWALENPPADADYAYPIMS